MYKPLDRELIGKVYIIQIVFKINLDRAWAIVPGEEESVTKMVNALEGLKCVKKIHTAVSSSVIKSEQNINCAHLLSYHLYIFVSLRLRANGRNNSQQVWDLQCIAGRIQAISLCNLCVMSVRGPNNVGRAVQTDPTLLRLASTITEQKKC